jgi:RNA polymerase sigma-70 factor (ECF subfamily)
MPDEIDATEESQSRLFDRDWAQAIMEEAARLQRERATGRGPEAVRRVELLQLRFEEGLPIRTIAERWRVEAARLHHDYAIGRHEFRSALLEVSALH